MSNDMSRSSLSRVKTNLGANVLFLLLVLGQAEIISAQSPTSQEPTLNFNRHSIIHPEVYHAGTKRELLSTKENDLRHAELLTVRFTVDGVEHLLDLKLNNDLIPVGYQQRHQTEEGSFRSHKPSAAEIELCHYQGSVRDIPDSWAAVSTCRGLRGVVFDGKTLYHIHPQNDSLKSPHYLFKQDDLAVNDTLGYDGHQANDDHRQKKNRMLRYKRDADIIRGPYNANNQSRYLELVMVIDKQGYMDLGEDLNRVHEHCKDIANILNALFTQLNIFIALVGIEVWSYADKITISSDGERTLNNFLEYRRNTLLREVPNDNAQLLTKKHFVGGVVGKALKGPICTFQFSGGVSVEHSEVIGLMAATVAHAIGHNLGMEHDALDCNCPDERCIMAPAVGLIAPTHWSSCSREYLKLAFEHGMDYCLRNKPEKLFGRSVCGNGFVEPGEECDCGSEVNCNNLCCNATSCTLVGNATCATGECCDIETCKPKTAGTVCRSNEGECDLPEYCTGQSEYCPSDVFKIDGGTCRSSEAFCYQGSCRTRDDQCKLLWGSTGSSADRLCYDMNNRGDVNGNCGYNQIESQFTKCNNTDVLCGMLHCKHLNERLEFGMEAVARLRTSFINVGGEIRPCRTAIIDMGLDQADPGLVPNGAKCGEGKMCVNQKCVSITCPNNCNGNGVCNSRGNCHCDPGFKPPLCADRGIGGSLDSGPAEISNVKDDDSLVSSSINQQSCRQDQSIFMIFLRAILRFQLIIDYDSNPSCK